MSGIVRFGRRRGVVIAECGGEGEGRFRRIVSPAPIVQMAPALSLIWANKNNEGYRQLEQRMAIGEAWHDTG